MRNKISLYLVVAIVAYGAGTFSSLQAQAPAPVKKDSEMLLKLSDKLDKVLANQEEMKASLKKIVGRV